MNIFDEGAVGKLAEALQILVETEKLLVVNNPEGGPAIDRENVRTYALAMIDEVTEWAGELSWKPWKLPKPVNVERLADEFADILAFLGVLAQLTQHFGPLTAEQLANQFREKSRVNIDRINLGKVEGYGGPLAQRIIDRSQLVAGNYYEVEYFGERRLAYLEGIGANGIHCFQLADVTNGVGTWWLTADDQGWIARSTNG